MHCCISCAVAVLDQNISGTQSLIDATVKKLTLMLVVLGQINIFQVQLYTEVHSV